MRSHKYCGYNLQIIFREHRLIISTDLLQVHLSATPRSGLPSDKVARGRPSSHNGAFCKVRSTLLLSRRRLCNYLDGTADKNRYQPPPPPGTPLYKLYKYVPLHRVGFLRRFGLTTGIHFAHFGLE